MGAAELGLYRVVVRWDQEKQVFLVNGKEPPGDLVMGLNFYGQDALLFLVDYLLERERMLRWACKHHQIWAPSATRTNLKRAAEEHRAAIDLAKGLLPSGGPARILGLLRHRSALTSIQKRLCDHLGLFTETEGHRLYIV